MTNGIFLLLGGNLGNPERTLKSVCEELIQASISVKIKSSLYKTAAWGNINQPDFLNQVICIETILSPQQLLEKILLTEQRLGRERKHKWGPRIIDIDILYYHDQIVNSTNLKIPHPEIQNRRFALLPMCEIAPDFIHPVYKKSQRILLAQCEDNLFVEKLT